MRYEKSVGFDTHEDQSSERENLRFRVSTSRANGRRASLSTSPCGGKEVRLNAALDTVGVSLGLFSSPALDNCQSSLLSLRTR